MGISLAFWILMLFWLIFGCWNQYVPNQPYPMKWAGFYLLQFVLFVLIGWKLFGAPIHGG